MSDSFYQLRKDIDSLQESVFWISQVDQHQTETLQAINYELDRFNDRISALEARKDNTLFSTCGISVIFILCLILAFVRSRKATTHEVKE